MNTLRRCLIGFLTVNLFLIWVNPLRAQGVKLRATPQKFRTFYRDLPLGSDSYRVPLPISNQLQTARTNAQIGKTVWRVESDAIIQESPAKLRLSFKEG